MLFTLADRWGEPDPTRLAALPANILTHWQAYFDLLNDESKTPAGQLPPAAASIPVSDDGFADCQRILGYG